MELTNVIRENFRDKRIERLKNSPRETLENLVNGQDVFLFQPTGSGKFESLGPERQITKSARSTSSHANRSVTFYICI